MIPITPNGQKWPVDLSNRLLRVIRSQAVAELRQRDRDKGVPDGPSYELVAQDGSLYDPSEVASMPDDEREAIGQLVGRPLASAGQKHSGNDTMSLVKLRWANFCSRPRDPSEWEKRLALSDADDLARQVKTTEAESRRRLRERGIEAVAEVKL